MSFHHIWDLCYHDISSTHNWAATSEVGAQLKPARLHRRILAYPRFFSLPLYHRVDIASNKQLSSVTGLQGLSAASEQCWMSNPLRPTSRALNEAPSQYSFQNSASLSVSFFRCLDNARRRLDERKMAACVWRLSYCPPAFQLPSALEWEMRYADYRPYNLPLTRLSLRKKLATFDLPIDTVAESRKLSSTATADSESNRLSPASSTNINHSAFSDEHIQIQIGEIKNPSTTKNVYSSYQVAFLDDDDYYDDEYILSSEKAVDITSAGINLSIPQNTNEAKLSHSSITFTGTGIKHYKSENPSIVTDRTFYADLEADISSDKLSTPSNADYLSIASPHDTVKISMMESLSSAGRRLADSEDLDKFIDLLNVLPLTTWSQSVSLMTEDLGSIQFGISPPPIDSVFLSHLDWLIADHTSLCVFWIFF
ncbi:unnamed protein product [Protopolystoma xenopodis]|uniref:Uncharacterized protein n=1 Tax=Protopolystoma xenopodis TaxID=117903 RepID=A0A3S5B0C9_9PLAT|nr:unnamed protein product [Protopolystoma xenopodis]